MIHDNRVLAECELYCFWYIQGGHYEFSQINSDQNIHYIIEGKSILYIMEKYNIPQVDVLKMDIEGSEFPVFCDNACDNWLKKTRYLIMEIHDGYMENGREMICKKMGNNSFHHIDYSGDDFFFR